MIRLCRRAGPMTVTGMDLLWAEGAGALILEEYEHAVARGAKFTENLLVQQ